MKNIELEKQLKQSVSYITPRSELWDSILQKCEEEQSTTIQKVEKKKPHTIIQTIGLVATIVLLMTMIFCNTFQQENYARASSILLEANSAVNIIIDEDENVLKVEALNEEGKKIVKGLKVEGETLEYVVEVITEKIIKEGGINAETSNVVISVDEEEQTKNRNLQSKLVKNIGDILKENDIYLEVVSQAVTNDEELKEIVKKYGVSFGKAEMMRMIVNNTYLYTMEELLQFNEMELNTMLPYIIESPYTLEEYMYGYKGQDYKLIEKAYEHACEDAKQQGATIDKFEIIIGFNNTNIEFIGFEEQIAEGQEYKLKYLYKMDILTGEIVSWEVDKMLNIMDYQKAWYIVRDSDLIPDGELCQLRSYIQNGKIWEFEFRTTNYSGSAKVHGTTGEVLYFFKYKRSVPDYDIIEFRDIEYMKGKQ